MLDLKLLRNDIIKVSSALASKGFKLDSDLFNDLDQKHKSVQSLVQSLQEQKNNQAKIVGMAKRQGNLDEALATMTNVNNELDIASRELDLINQKLADFLLAIPNIPHASVPIGMNENDYQVIRLGGEIKNFNFIPKSHEELGAVNSGIDLLSSAEISGARFMVLQGPIARLHRALAQFMLDVHTTQHGYKEVYVPYLVKSQALVGTGQLPKFKEDLFRIADHDLWLIPTAEVPLTNLVRDKILAIEQLPLRFVCHSPCFRSEVGSYGKDTKGIIRRHQFDKVELVQIVKPDNSYQALEEMVQHAEKILQLLELPYRIIALPTSDLSIAAAKTYDLEVWLPEQKMYREISSCSNTESFQARRLKARFRNNQKPEFVHTLNGSGVAVGRALSAVMENYQDSSGRIHIPKVLEKYMQGITVIEGFAHLR